MRIVLSFALAALAGTQPAHAADGQNWWIVRQQDAQGNTHLAESSTIEWRADGEVYFWSHLFYAYPQEGLRSALIEYSVHCAERTIAEHRYIDFDANREEITSGDNAGSNRKTPRPATTGDDYLKFACSSDANRAKQFLRVDAKASHWGVGEFFSDPRPLVTRKLDESAGD